MSRDYNSLKSAQNLVLLVLAVLLIPGFALWAEWQERRGRPALIPNSLWKNAAFTSTCIIVFFTWAVFNAFQYFSALFFERVLRLTALQAAVRFLPMVFVGAATNVVSAFLFVTHSPADIPYQRHDMGLVLTDPSHSSLGYGVLRG